MRKVARRRVPRFALDYLEGGIGLGTALQHNRNTLDNVGFMPRYLVDDADDPDCSCTFLGQKFDWPFGVAPVGMGGLIWPKAAEYLAAAATEYNIPFILSGFATASMEDIAAIAGANGWYQHYMFTEDEINQILIKRALDCGYRTLVITVDIPTETRRAHDIRNGLSVPPRFNTGTLMEILKCPRWSLETLQAGIPEFQNYLEFMPDRRDLDSTAVFLQRMTAGHVSLERLQKVRDLWPHDLIVKGVLHSRDALDSKGIGVDALVVSNHGGRQLDAASSAIEAIGDIRRAVGDEMPLIADGGVETGLDIMRYLASGADFVIAGRAFMYAVAAMGKPGAAHVMNVLSQEFHCTMAQLGAANISMLPQFLEGS
jgi:L-lactate dehydrogenase (cytochrome)